MGLGGDQRHDHCLGVFANLIERGTREIVVNLSMTKHTRKPKNGNALKPAAATPELAKSTLAKPESVKAAPMRAAVARPEPSRAMPARTEIAKPNPAPLAQAQPKPAATPAAPTVPAKLELVKPRTIPAGPVKTAAPTLNHISLELIRPGAHQVCVAGSFNEWKPEATPLVSLGNGRWVGDLTVKPGRYEYLFVVDGQWLPDPNAKESVQNPFGGTNSVLIAAE